MRELIIIYVIRVAVVMLLVTTAWVTIRLICAGSRS